MYILAAIDDNLTLRVPQFFCCNCGSAEGIRPAATSLTATRLVPIGGQHTVRLELPYCRRCTRTSKREPVGLATKLMVGAILALVFGLLASVLPLQGMPGWLSGNIFLLSAAAALAIVPGLYALQRPRGSQTSYYQPIRLSKLGRKRSGRIACVTLTFTHPKYAETFASANKEAIESGVLIVSAP